MENILKFIVAILPMLFAFGFLVPLIAQSMNTLGLIAPFGLSTLVFALIVGGSLGLIAQIRGRWI